MRKSATSPAIIAAAVVAGVATGLVISRRNCIICHREVDFVKKLFFIILTLIIITAVTAACDISPADKDGSTTGSVTTVTEPVSSDSGESDDTTGTEPARSPLYPLFAHDVVVHSFASVEDLETYLYTGSTDDSDYATPPDFDAFSSITGYTMHKYLQTGYLPLNEVFGTDPDSSDKFDIVTFSIPSGSIVFQYYYDDICIDTIYLRDQSEEISASGYYEAYCDYASVEYQPLSYAQSGYTGSGYVTRTVGENEIVYRVENGVPRQAVVCLDKWIVKISVASSEDDATAEEQFNAFMSSDEMSALTALFSDNASALQSQLAELEGNAAVVAERVSEITYQTE